MTKSSNALKELGEGLSQALTNGGTVFLTKDEEKDYRNFLEEARLVYRSMFEDFKKSHTTLESVEMLRSKRRLTLIAQRACDKAFSEIIKENEN